MEFGRANGRSVTPVNGSVSPMRKKARGGDGHHGEIPIEISTSMCSSSQNNGQNGFPCIPSASRSGALYVQSHPQSFPRVPSASRGATPTPSDFSQRSPSVDRRVDLDSGSNPVCGPNCRVTNAKAFSVFKRVLQTRSYKGTGPSLLNKVLFLMRVYT